jgi:hypothetical protein
MSVMRKYYVRALRARPEGRAEDKSLATLAFAQFYGKGSRFIYLTRHRQPAPPRLVPLPPPRLPQHAPGHALLPPGATLLVVVEKPEAEFGYVGTGTVGDRIIA